MTIIALFIAATLGIVIFPILIPYLLVTYMALNGIASRHFINDLKVTVTGTNIFFPDLLYAAAVVLALYGILRLLFSGQLRRYAPLTKGALLLSICYVFFFVGKIINGYFESVPADALVRRFALDTQCVYLFVPLFYIKQEKTLRKLLYYVVIITLLFPFAQPFLYGSADQVALEQGQGGTLRLGFGNANLLLMLGVLAFFVWERRMWLSALPLAGIGMLAQRSAYISITLCILVLAVQKKKGMKFIALVGGAGLLLIAALMLIQTTSSVPVVQKTAERLSQTFQETGSTKARMLVIPVALREFSNRPWVGYSYRDMNQLSQKQDRDAFSFNMLHPHNFVLSSLLRTGMVGTLLLFGIICVLMLAAFRLSRQRDTHEQGMYLFSTMLFFVVFGLMNTSFISAGYVFWVLAGVTLWYLNQVQHLNYQQRRSRR